MNFTARLNKIFTDKCSENRKQAQQDKLMITNVVNHYQKLQLSLDDLNKLLGLTTESTFANVIYSTLDTLIKTTSVVIDDKRGYIEWYIYKHDCGKLGLFNGIGDCSTWGQIKTTDDLIRLINNAK